MPNSDDIPAYTSDLIEWLDANVKTPTFPLTVNGAQGLSEDVVRRGCFQAGSRALVDQLIAWKQATEEAHGAAAQEDSESDPSQLRFPNIFGSDGELVERQSPVRVVD